MCRCLLRTHANAGPLRPVSGLVQIQPVLPTPLARRADLGGLVHVEPVLPALLSADAQSLRRHEDDVLVPVLAPVHVIVFDKICLAHVGVLACAYGRKCLRASSLAL